MPSSHSLFPTFQWIHEMPSPMINSARFLRFHKKAIKDTARELMTEHHKKTMPKHFKRTARSRYDHKERSASWKAKKRRVYHSITDLVATGITRDKMLNDKPEISISGDPTRMIIATMVLKFPFGREHDNKKPGKVSMTDMANELATWHPEETNSLGEEFAKRYAQKLKVVLKTAPKWRQKMRASGGFSPGGPMRGPL